ncbi:MAG: phosphoglycerate dehydrogenase [Flavobacteriales bacterium]|nr:phosphoglycerate dehydrogenase [Flavobacteriales bacterium]
MKILLTSTSFQDTPGEHHALLNSNDFEVDRLRGPLKAEILKPIIHQYDGIICGDDEYTREVLLAGKQGKLKVISKYGIGLDKIDLEAAKELGITVTNCPGVNHTTVAEHVFALLLSYCKHIPDEINYTRQGEWKRITGIEIWGKTIGIVGLGNIGKEVALRAIAFGLKVHAYDINPDMEFISKHQIMLHDSFESILPLCDILSLHVGLSKATKHLLNTKRFSILKPGCILINTARGELVELHPLIENLQNKRLRAYLTDVLEEEPMPKDHPLKNIPNVFITPHIGSRTYESVVRQGTMAVKNLLNHLIYANK